MIRVSVHPPAGTPVAREDLAKRGFRDESAIRRPHAGSTSSSKLTAGLTMAARDEEQA